MARGYVYKKRVKRSQYSNFRRYLFLTIIFIVAFGVVGYYIYSGLRSQPDKSAISAVQNSVVSGDQNTFTNDYFSFKDNGTWVIDKNNTNAQRIIYHKFDKNVLQAELIVYINQDPIPLYSAVPRALPLRIVNDNSFAPTNVSTPCNSQYAKGDLHKVKLVSIDGATMLCDPDSPQYFIILSEINADYHLHLKMSDGKPIEFVITYKDDIDADTPTSVLNIASTFHTR